MWASKRKHDDGLPLGPAHLSNGVGEAIMRCACGCGLETGWRRGKPCRYMHGHHRRKGVHPRNGMAYILSNIEIVSESGCWIWMRHISGSTGYAQARVRLIGTRWELDNVHRYSYELLHGPIPDGMHVDHICKVRCCVNPSHLRLLTPRQNVLVGVGPSALNSAKTHCPKGHEYNERNTYMSKVGKRHCRPCAAEKERLRRQRLGGAL